MEQGNHSFVRVADFTAREFRFHDYAQHRTDVLIVGD